MGHQFYARLSGEDIEGFRRELEQDEPDRERAVDYGAKGVFHRIVQLYAAGDLERVSQTIVAALAEADGVREHDLSLIAKAKVLERLRQSCIYPDEAGQVAVHVMSDLRALRRELAKGVASPLEPCFHAAAEVTGMQIAHPEVVTHLPRDGFLGSHALASDMAARLARRAYKSIVSQYRANPQGWRDGAWQAPRARSPRRTQAQTGGLNVG